MSKLDRILHEFENEGAKEKPTSFDPHRMAEEIQTLRADCTAARERAFAAEEKLGKLEERKCNSGHDNHLPLRLWDCPTCTELTRKKLEAAEEKIAAAEEKIESWRDFHRVDRKIVGGGLKALGEMLEEISRERDKAKEFGQKQATAAEAAEKEIKRLEGDIRILVTTTKEQALEAAKFYDGDGDYKMLPAEEVKARRIACALELRILRAETYARTTAPLDPEERALLFEELQKYELTMGDKFERNLGMAKLQRMIEKMMQARSLVRSASERGVGVAAERAIEVFYPVLTKARAVKVQAEKGAIPVLAGLAQVVEVLETAMRSMETMKLIADSAPRPNRASARLLIVVPKIIKRIESWAMDEDSGLMSIEEALAIKDDLVNAMADTKGEAEG